MRSAGRATGLLLLEDGTAFFGEGLGAPGQGFGTLCFNTSHSGYQEILTDPSYAGEIVVFTFPHVGNVGTNSGDRESGRVHAAGLVLREPPTSPSNWRSEQPLPAWLAQEGTRAIARVDTRSLVRRLRDYGAQRGLVLCDPSGALADPAFDLRPLLEELRARPGLEGADLAGEVSCKEPYAWSEGPWREPPPALTEAAPRIVVYDYGVKQSLLRRLAGAGARVTVVPAYARPADVLALAPDGLFLSNGPGDPEAAGASAEGILRELFAEAPALPVFGVCMGHQLLARAFGCRTFKLSFGHHGANHPVLERATGRVRVTSQNHNFAVAVGAELPAGLEASHESLFDRTNEGLIWKEHPIRSVQFHPEASPGPRDSLDLLSAFVEDARQARLAAPAARRRA